MSVTKSRLISVWANIVRRRNQIAYQGDMPKGKRRGKHKLNLIGAKYAGVTLKLCERLVTAANTEMMTRSVDAARYRGDSRSWGEESVPGSARIMAL